MNTYPSLHQAIGSRPGMLDDLVIDRAANGTAKVRAFFAAVKRNFSVVHKAISASDRTTLLAFYAANRTVAFYFTAEDDGVMRTVVFKRAPVIEPIGLYFNITNEMEEV